MSALSSTNRRLLERFTSPAAASVFSDALDDVAATSGALTPTAVQTTDQSAEFGQLVTFDATAGALTCTAPDPAGAAGQSWGMKLIATASAHTLTAVAYSAETFDGGAAPSTSTAGGLYVFTSDGTNWVITSKI